MSTVTKIVQVNGTALAVRGNDIDTDRILPARYLKESTFSRMGEYPFYDERFDQEGKAKPHPFNDSKYKGATILFVNKNFGCGSSREHAPQALYRYGIHAIVGESFGAIFANNCVMMGVPTVTVSAEAMEELMRSAESLPETIYKVDLETITLSSDGKQIRFELPGTYRSALISGAWDSTSMLRANLDKVKRVASKLPYMSGFRK
ncbi:MAG: 3-isopropylmalate dehydratase small subunit [Candidatus Binatia bacterium]